MNKNRTHRSSARRVLTVCALTGAALLTAVTGGNAWADGVKTPAPAAPSIAGSPAPGAAVPSVGSGATPARTGQPAPATPVVGGTPTATPAAGGTGPQVREVPAGAAQAGDGSGSASTSGPLLVGGGTVAALGAGALGFALLRRRSGARG
ncbi:hypothetical protein [Kitasatospora sp. NPDC088351]|uniref:hypothetical protein n=1 Tax=unclassified Kitasatospora TaxID=2633591 RepID=UPI0034446FCF